MSPRTLVRDVIFFELLLASPLGALSGCVAIEVKVWTDHTAFLLGGDEVRSNVAGAVGINSINPNPQ